MQSVHEYRDSVLALARTLPVMRTPLLDAVGLVLAEDVFAPRPMPGFDNAAMDGYALRSTDAAVEEDRVLTVVGEIAAGGLPTQPVTAGHVVRIMTGAPVPPGADAVVPVERTDGGVDVVRISGRVESGAHIRRAGEDIAADTLAVASGTRITSGMVALLAACDRADVLVHRRARVVVISTGDELVVAGDAVGPGQIVDSNGPLLCALLAADGVSVRHLGPVADNAAAFGGALADACSDADLVITSGGVSMGAYDTVKEVLSAIGGVHFTKVAMNPGMPQGCGVIDGVPIVTLPGNPVSTYVSYVVFAAPLLRAMQGRRDVLPSQRRARISEALRSPESKTQFARGVLAGDDELVVRPVTGQGSHSMLGLAQANCLIVIPEGVGLAEAGSAVDVIDLR